MEVLKAEGTIISKNKNKYYLRKQLGVMKGGLTNEKTT
jgi:hypothetical protein